MNICPLESIILDFRHFLDEALTFIESFEEGERDPHHHRFFTDKTEIGRLRNYAIEYTRLVFDLKKLLNNDTTSQPRQYDGDSAVTKSHFGDFNVRLAFSEQFKANRLLFFTFLFERLDKLFNRVNALTLNSTSSNDNNLKTKNTTNTNELVRLFFKLVQKLTRKTNEFVGYLESPRWHRAMALQILDRLVALVNDFSCVFEKFVEKLEEKGRIVEKKEEIVGSGDTRKKKTAQKPNLVDHLSVSEAVSGTYRPCAKSKVHYCPCVYLILLIFATVSIILVAKFFWQSVFYEADGQQPNQQSNEIEKDSFDLLSFMDLDFSLFEDKEAVVKISLTGDESENVEFYLWDQIVKYMQRVHLIVLSLTAFVSFEWVLNN